MFKVTSLLMLLFLGSSAQTGDCGCNPDSADQITNWGKQNTIQKEAATFKSMSGKVVAGGKPLEGVLVEIYDKPEGLLMGWKERERRKSKQHRIAACVTGPDGEFCFPQIAAGRYELRGSKKFDWDATSVYVVIDPGSSRSTKRKLVMRMEMSQ